MTPRVVLTGFMGSGKSTVGRALARSLGVAYLDTDAEIERRSGRSIPEIFADGEPAFRTIERDTVLDVLATADGVVALGGGSVTVPEIAAALAGRPVVYLRIGPDEGFARVAHSDRPLLAHPDPATRYADLLAARTPAYAAVAAHTVDAQRPVDEIVDELAAYVRAVPVQPSGPPADSAEAARMPAGSAGAARPPAGSAGAARPPAEPREVRARVEATTEEGDRP